MKVMRLILGMFLMCATTNLSAEESGGFWGWLTGVTSSAWEGTKNTVRSLFGDKPEEKVVHQKEEIRETDVTNDAKAKEEVVKKEETIVKK